MFGLGKSKKQKGQQKPRAEIIYEVTETNIAMLREATAYVFQKGAFFQGVDNAYTAAKELMWRFCAAIQLKRDYAEAWREVNRVSSFVELAEQGLSVAAREGRADNYHVFVRRALPLLAAQTILDSSIACRLAETLMRDPAFACDRPEEWGINSVRKYCALLLDDMQSFKFQANETLGMLHPDRSLPKWRQDCWEYDQVMLAILDRDVRRLDDALNACRIRFQGRESIMIESEEDPIEGLGPVDHGFVFDWLSLALCFLATDRGMEVSTDSREIPFLGIYDYARNQGGR